MPIPFVSRWLLHRKVKSIKKKLQKAKDKFCEQADQVDRAKDDAARMFYKRDWDKIQTDLDAAVNEACDCAGSIKLKSKGVGTGVSAGGPDLTKDCKEKVAKILYPAKGKFTGHYKKEDKEIQNAMIAKCKEKSGVITEADVPKKEAPAAAPAKKEEPALAGSRRRRHRR